ncbi:hypothetical protein RHS01_09113 [Rhizoctonia solani]|uniref:Jacalin-type lectin domain-containing protein n=1 Tax=Rhizoctonia solani TaxID=456999 RepID=A0A8H7I642_9AGAM|nr:hypothetical protein RHS01_09113 [Rhizoctonia solani]
MDFMQASPLTWRQIRITKVAPTIELLPPKIQERLLELYAKRLSYVPAITIGPGDSSSKTYEDTPHATKQISSVTVYTSDWIRSMRFTYADKTCSIKHEGTEGYGAVHEFKLVEGEYITEMIIWHSQQQYIGGLQFITNLGRCSPHLGGARLKVPKECDVFSDYYGSKDGRPFNDRIVVRNSDIAISQIEVWSAGVIDSIQHTPQQFTYVDSKNKAGSRILSDRHGGMGGSKKAPFVLGSGEHIFGISGRHDNSRITQLTFITNRGRTSDVFGVGQSTGESQSFSVSSPEDHEGNRMRLQYICGKCTTYRDVKSAILPLPTPRQPGLCGFRVDSMDEPQVSARQVATYANGAMPFIQEVNSVHTELIATHDQRTANYVHHGWSIDAVETVSPWILSRIDAKNRLSEKGKWMTRRTLARRLRVQVMVEDLSPVPEFARAIIEALEKPSLYKRFRAVYLAMSRWGDVVPLEIEMGSSLTLTDTEVNFDQLPKTNVYNSLTHLSTIKTARISRYGGATSAGWEDGRWIIMDVAPTSEWQTIKIVAVAPIFSLLADDIQVQITNLYNERLSYVPPLTINPIRWQCQIHDDTSNASKTISRIITHSSDNIDRFEVDYLGDAIPQLDKDEANKHTFTLTHGEHIVEILASGDDDGLRGVQFITNKGRCSAIYGTLEGVPTIARSKGGILAGLSVTSKVHPTRGYLATSFRGIWRHDLIPHAPKENDVFSEYFGARTHHGSGFNDRALVGNSSTMCISRVEFWAGVEIDSIQIQLARRITREKYVRHVTVGSAGLAPHWI